MPVFLNDVLAAASNEIHELCANNMECIFDTVQTGNSEIGLETLETQQTNMKDQTIVCKLYLLILSSLMLEILF